MNSNLEAAIQEAMMELDRPAGNEEDGDKAGLKGAKVKISKKRKPKQ